MTITVSKGLGVASFGRADTDDEKVSRSTSQPVTVTECA